MADQWVTWTVFFWVVGGVVVYVTGCWIYAWLTTNVLHSRVSNAGRRLDDHREKVAQEYVRHEHLQATEQRFTSALDGVRSDIKDMTRSVDRLAGTVNRMAGTRSHDGDEP